MVAQSAGSAAIPDAVNCRNDANGNLWIDVMELQGLSTHANNHSKIIILYFRMNSTRIIGWIITLVF